jgi:hypothetical protein
MPEAAVDEDGNSGCAKLKVTLPASTWNDWPLKPVAKPAPE